MAEWSKLVDDLLVEIAKRIRTYEDFVCFGGVCRSWQSAAVKENFGHASAQIPWLMLPPKTCNCELNYNDMPSRSWQLAAVKENFGHASALIPWLMLPPKICNCKLDYNDLPSFFRVSTGKIREVYLPEVNGKKCLSSKGWLLTIAQDDLSMSLLHPFSRIQINLPDMKTFQNFKVNSKVFFIKKCALSADPSSTANYVFMVIHGGLGKLAYYKPGDKVWTTLHEWESRYTDVAYYKGRFYAIACLGKLAACDFSGGDDDPATATVVSNIPKYIWKLTSHLYVVESAGSLLVLVRLIKSEYDEHRNKRIKWTYGFQVFQWDLDTNTWLEVKDLGNRAIFLGYNSSFSLEASDRCMSNCIYFTDDDTRFHLRNHDHGGKDMGIYKMKDGNIEPILGNYLNPINPPMWV